MSFRALSVIFLSALAVEVYAHLSQNVGLQFFSKPSLMLILIFYYAVNARRLSGEKYLILAALFFSWLGDVLLLFDKFTSYFIYGLTAFLTAHLFYIFYFWKIRRSNKIQQLPNIFFFVGIAVYSVLFFSFLAPNVADLIVPVGIYGLIISIMLGMSLTSFDLGKSVFGKFCVAGAFLFAVSDSVLAINRFAMPMKYAPALIMITYGIAQFLITEGSLRNLREIEKTRTLQN